MKGTILYAEYDEGTGVSVVTKQTKYGTFTRSVRVHPQDEDIANQYDGCYFAELKCDIAAYQEKAKFMRERAKGITHAFNVLSYADTQRDPYIEDMKEEWYALAHQADIAWKQAEDATETYHILKDAYYALIEQTLRQRRELRDKINKKRHAQD
jgi:hypothetical protein